MPTPVNKLPFQTVSVLGSGTMGAGIAQILAQAGCTVWLYDIETRFLESGLGRIQASLDAGVAKGKFTPEAAESALKKINTTTQLDLLRDCELIIEAVPEDLALKQGLFQSLDSICPANTLFASNTSSLSITALASATKRPQQFAGLHFFNPVPLMKLVEVIEGRQTDESTIKQLWELSLALNKTPVRAKDTPGFIVNRVARPYYGESFRILSDQVGDVAMIDQILTEAGGFRMGPFTLMDLIGIDINFAVTQTVYNGYFQEPRYRPHPIQAQMVAAGLLGKKTGQGFYTYENKHGK
ncbi:MAG: 3-hydroxybutyryl-CoA dehydrogenase [Cyanobacteria bacterium]|nr:3-hydroxybutyryl-CoA dehydrogenase [Cyanobacteriota bacterium]